MPSQQITESCVSEFNRIERAMLHSKDMPSWLKTLKQDAIKHFSQQGFPSVRHEDWKYTPLSSLVNNRFILASIPTNRLLETLKERIPECIVDSEWPRLIFVNGYMISEWSTLPQNLQGVKCGRLTDSLREQSKSLYDQDFEMNHLTPWFQSQPLTALNTALFLEGACICIDADTNLEHPLHLIFIQSQENENKVMVFPRNQIHLAHNSRAQVIESHYSFSTSDCELTTSLIDSLSQIRLDEKAHLDYFRTHRSTCPTHHFATSYASLGKDSVFNSYSFVFNTAFSRNYHFVEHQGEKSQSHLSGLSCLNKNYFSDQFTLVEHTKPQCQSEQLYKGILSGSAQGFFSGKIIVHQNAQQTDAKQLNKNLLLSNTSTAYTKPQLEINANDVKCTHGASVGALDKEAIFYLRTRGIKENESKYLLAQAFAGEVVSRIQLKPLRKQIESELNLFLGASMQEIN